MPAHRRSRGQRAQDLVKVAQWYGQGLTQGEIGQRLGLTQQQISYDLKALIQQWQAEATSEIDKMRAKDLLRLNEIERVAWADYGLSRRVIVEDPDGQPVAALFEQPGDPRFLAIIQHCISERAKILGLYAPTKVAPTMPDGDAPYQPIETYEQKAALREALAEIGLIPGPADQGSE